MNQTNQLIEKLKMELIDVKPTLPTDLDPDDHLKNIWGLDSLELVEFVARIERTYKMIIPDEDLKCFTSLSASSEYIHKRLAA